MVVFCSFPFMHPDAWQYDLVTYVVWLTIWIYLVAVGASQLKPENLENYSKLTCKHKRPPASPSSVPSPGKYLVHGLSVGDIVFATDGYDFHISLTLIFLGHGMVASFACASV